MKYYVLIDASDYSRKVITENREYIIGAFIPTMGEEWADKYVDCCELCNEFELERIPLNTGLTTFAPEVSIIQHMFMAYDKLKEIGDEDAGLIIATDLYHFLPDRDMRFMMKLVKGVYDIIEKDGKCDSKKYFMQLLGLSFDRQTVCSECRPDKCTTCDCGRSTRENGS